MKEKIIKIIYSRIEELPTLPEVITRLIMLLNDEHSSSRDISGILSRDPALASKVLKVANSAYYGFQRQITNINDAVVLLGYNMIRSIALSMGVIENLSSKKTKSFSEKDLWIHSLTVATAMQKLSEAYHYEGKEHTFIIGLLHDIGKIIFDLFLPEEYERVIEESQNRGERIHDTERRIIGIDHGEAGAMLLHRWNFPELIVFPVKKHHFTAENGNSPLINLLRVSDAVTLSMSEEEFFDWRSSIRKDLESLNVDDETIDNLVDYLKDSKEAILGFYNAIR